MMSCQISWFEPHFNLWNVLAPCLSCFEIVASLIFPGNGCSSSSSSSHSWIGRNLRSCDLVILRSCELENLKHSKFTSSVTKPRPLCFQGNEKRGLLEDHDVAIDLCILCNISLIAVVCGRGCGQGSLKCGLGSVWLWLERIRNGPHPGWKLSPCLACKIYGSLINQIPRRFNHQHHIISSLLPLVLYPWWIQSACNAA